jgi:hypothetical protein
MSRSVVASLVAVCLLIMPLTASGSEPFPKKDWQLLKGDWVSPTPANGGEKAQTRRRIHLEESRFGQTVTVNEDFRQERDRHFRTGGPVHSRVLVIGSLERRAGKTFMVIVPAGERSDDTRFEVAYQIVGNTLRLQGNIGGANVSGRWIRPEAARGPVNTPRG